jgi:hypothetical protein
MTKRNDNDFINIVYNNYMKSGLLYRTTDFQSPASKTNMLNGIKNLTVEDDIPEGSNKTKDLLNVLTNVGPYFSASGLSGAYNLPPLLWYSYVSDVKTNGTKISPVGQRVMVGFIMDYTKINVSGGAVWDFDSNFDQYGNYPNVIEAGKRTASSFFSQTLPFSLPKKVGNFDYVQPTSNNNNRLMNPLFIPETNNGIASNSKDIKTFLNLVSEYRSTWVDTLKKSSGGYNEKLGKYLDNNYGTGLESEIQISSKNKVQYSKKKFNPEDILCIALISDSQEPIENLLTKKEIIHAVFNQIVSAVDKNNGWIFNNKFDWTTLPVVDINGVALPAVPIDSSQGTLNPGIEWMDYLNKNSKYSKPLTKNNFKLIDLLKD